MSTPLPITREELLERQRVALAERDHHLAAAAACAGKLELLEELLGRPDSAPNAGATQPEEAR